MFPKTSSPLINGWQPSEVTPADPDGSVGSSSSTSTSRPSIVRFAHRLGFDGYTELQEYVRSRLSQQLARPSVRIRHDDSTTTAARLALEDAMTSVFEAIEDADIAKLATPVVHADTVWVLGQL